MGRKSDGSIKTKRSKKSDKAKKTFDKNGKYSDKHLRTQQAIIEQARDKRGPDQKGSKFDKK